MGLGDLNLSPEYRVGCGNNLPIARSRVKSNSPLMIEQDEADGLHVDIMTGLRDLPEFEVPACSTDRFLIPHL